MFGIRYLKAPPTTYVLQYQGGLVKREGPGLSFFYFAPASTLVAVPLASTDQPFLFEEVTADYQEVRVQGQLTYRVTEPRRLASLFDLTVDADLRYRGDDLERVAERLLQLAQVLARARLQTWTLEEAVVASDALSGEVLAGLRESPAVEDMGVEVLGLSILAVRPTPETAKALEADAREGLLRRADLAIYERRNASIEQERRVRENELRTELAVEAKRREIRESKMEADIAVEQQRAELIDARVDNEKKDADSRAYAVRVHLEPIKEADWKTLMVLQSAGAAQPGSMIAMAFQQLAENAEKVGTLNISPDLLQSLVDARGGES